MPKIIQTNLLAYYNCILLTFINTMTSNLPAVISLAETDYFTGIHWQPFKNLWTTAAKTCRIYGYYDGSIPKPIIAAMTTIPAATTATTSIGNPADIKPPVLTPLYSTNPSIKEWEAYDAYAYGYLFLNINTPGGVGMQMDCSAKQAWTSLIDTYNDISNGSLLEITIEICTIKYHDREDFDMHIFALHSKLAEANDMGAKIEDLEFQMAIFLLLPPSWDVIVATLDFVNQSSKVLIHLL